MKKYLILFLLLFYNSAFSEIVKKIEITGNERISDETIKVYGNISINSDYGNNEINQILKNLYSTNFFENVDISLNNGILKIALKEYQIINSIKIEGEKANKIKKGIKEQLTLKEKGSFLKNNLNKDINTIKRLYESIGFNFTEVDVKYEEFSEKRVNLIFYVKKGERTKISKINFIGDKKFRDRRLRDIIVSEEDAFYKFITKNTYLNKDNIELDKRLLVNYYKSMGYYDVQIISSNAEITQDYQTTLTFNINAGIRYRITKITTNVSESIDKKVFIPLNKEFKKIIGKYYSPFTIKKLLDEVDVLINDNDLQFVQHSVNEALSGDNIEVKINIFEGPKKIVERINIQGNTITNENVIRSELKLDEGDPFNKLKLDQSISELKARNIFGSVSQSVSEGSSKDLKIIDISVEEKPTGEISAGAGVGTNGGSFSFSIKENNWLGDGIRLSTFVNIDSETLKGAVEVTNPNYNLTGNELNFGISSTANDKPDAGYENNIISTSIGTSFEQYKDVYLSPSLIFTHDDLTVLTGASDNLTKQAGSFTDLSFRYGIFLDKRDRVFMPTDGFLSNFSQTLPVFADSPSLRNSYSFSKYTSFGKNVVGAFKFYGSAINGFSDDVRLSKRLNLNQNRLRGFESGKIGPKDGNDYVGGNYAAAINLETNLPNLLPESTKTDIGLFLDFGNVWSVDYSDNIDDSNKIRSSAGINTSWLSPVGPMTFVISQNISKASTDSTESFNFRLGTTF